MILEAEKNVSPSATIRVFASDRVIVLATRLVAKYCPDARCAQWRFADNENGTRLQKTALDLVAKVEGEKMLANTTQQILNAKADSDRVHVVGTIVEVGLIAAVAIALHFFPEKVGVIKSLTDPSSFTPLLAAKFQDHMPMLNLYWGLAASLCIANLTLRRWNIVTRCAELGLNILALSILVQMVLGGPITVSPGITMLIKFGLAIAVIPTCVTVVREIHELISKYTITVQSKA